MFHEVWLQDMEEQVKELKANYPNASLDDKRKWRKRFSELRQASHQLLEVWAKVEEQIASLSADHPELSGEQEIEMEEEFWLHESVVRQFRKGQGYYDLTMFQEAKELFAEVVEEEPEFLLGRIYLGLSAFQRNELDIAYTHFQMVSATASQTPFLVFTHHMMGCIRVKQGKDQLAIKSFQEAVTYDAEHADAWFNLGASHYRLGQYHEAIPVFYHALALNEQDWEAMYYLSSCYRHYREWTSVSYWRMASYERSQHPQVILSIAHDFEEMGESEQAIEWYRKLLNHPEYKRVAFYGVSWNYWVLRNPHEAELWVKKGLTLYPKDSDLLFTLMWIKLAEGQIERAEKIYSLLSDDAKQEPIWQAMKIRIFSHIGQLDDVVIMADKLIQQEKPMVQAMGYYHKGRSMLEMGQVNEAVEHFQLARLKAQRWQEPIFYEGVCHLLAGRTEQMKHCWKQLHLV